MQPTQVAVAHVVISSGGAMAEHRFFLRSCLPSGNRASPEITRDLPSVLVACIALAFAPGAVRADTTPVQMLDPNLQVTTFVGAGLSQPIGIVFLAANDAL